MDKEMSTLHAYGNSFLTIDVCSGRDCSTSFVFGRLRTGDVVKTGSG